MAFLLAVFLVAALVGLAYSAVQALTQWQRATKADVECAAATTRYTELRDKYNADIGRCKQFIAGVKAENERLSKWKDVADADAKAAAMLVAAKTSLDRANADAAHLTAEVEQKVTVALSEASNAASASWRKRSERRRSCATSRRQPSTRPPRRPQRLSRRQIIARRRLPEALTRQ